MQMRTNQKLTPLPPIKRVQKNLSTHSGNGPVTMKNLIEPKFPHRHLWKKVRSWKSKPPNAIWTDEVGNVGTSEGNKGSETVVFEVH
jgi:hypothetical protein